MTREEQKDITAFVVRVAADESECLDVEADAIIRALFVRNPDAAFRITRLAMKLCQAPPCAPVDCVADKVPAPKRGFFPSLFRREPEPEDAALVDRITSRT